MRQVLPLPHRHPAPGGAPGRDRRAAPGRGLEGRGPRHRAHDAGAQRLWPRDRGAADHREPATLFPRARGRAPGQEPMTLAEPEVKVRTSKLTLDGVELEFREGETLYEVARRARKDVPTLCYDPRLEAFGACRLCVVEVAGSRNPVASCTAKAQAGMVVKTRTEALERHRKTLLELVVSENPAGAERGLDPLRGHASGELAALARSYGVDGTRFAGARSGHSRGDDTNPMILRDYDHCISCYRCVRVCAEQEGDYAISIANRGFKTRITTEFDGMLRDSACTFC